MISEGVPKGAGHVVVILDILKLPSTDFNARKYAYIVILFMYNDFLANLLSSYISKWPLCQILSEVDFGILTNHYSSCVEIKIIGLVDVIGLIGESYYSISIGKKHFI